MYTPLSAKELCQHVFMEIKWSLNGRLRMEDLNYGANRVAVWWHPLNKTLLFMSLTRKRMM